MQEKGGWHDVTMQPEMIKQLENYVEETKEMEYGYQVNYSQDIKFVKKYV